MTEAKERTCIQSRKLLKVLPLAKCQKSCPGVVVVMMIGPKGDFWVDRFLEGRSIYPLKKDMTHILIRVPTEETVETYIYSNRVKTKDSD